MKFINVTPHDIHLNDGSIFPKSGTVARVSATFTQPIGLVCSQVFGEVEDLPTPQEGFLFIVSAIVLGAAKAQGRVDCVAPATGHNDVVRNDKGHIVSVPCFVS